MQRRTRLILGVLTVLAATAGAWRYLHAPLHIVPGEPGAFVPGGPIPGDPPARPATEVLKVPPVLAKGAFAVPHTLTLPAGFHVALWATNLPGVRLMAIGPHTGDVYATETGGGRVVRISDPLNRGNPVVTTIISGLDRPHGIVWQNGQLYIAENGRVIRLHYRDGDTIADGFDAIAELVGGGGHVTRSIAFGPDGKLYVAAGSSCNVCQETDERRAAIARYGADGGYDGIYARGMRNAVGITFRPGTDELWAVVNGRDGLGDDLPPEQLDRVQAGDDFGWPVCHGWGIIDPQYGNNHSCQGKAAPALPIQAHSAPLAVRFYDGRLFPAEYQGDLFIALHGSWNRTEPTGAKVIRVHMHGDKPASASYENFLTGFQLPNGSRWGRPVDLVVAPDGALLLSDDASGSIYRIWYDGGAGA